jgi:hypothetical protein
MGRCVFWGSCTSRWMVCELYYVLNLAMAHARCCLALELSNVCDEHLSTVTCSDSARFCGCLLILSGVLKGRRLFPVVEVVLRPEREG